MESKRQVFFNSDARGITLLAVAVYSLLQRNDPTQPIHLYVAHDRSFAETGCIGRIREIVNRFPFAKVSFLDFSPCTQRYGKNFEPMLWAFPLCDKLLPADVTGTIVYIDIDMLIRKDLGPLYDMDLKAQGMMAAAVNESRREHRPYLVAAGWPKAAGYSFNNATTVLDLDRFRSEHASDRMIEWYERNATTAKCLDQDAQNVIYGEKTVRLHPKWNYTDGWLERILKLNPFAKEWRVFPPHEILEAILDPCIIHYIGRHKPTAWTHRPERNVYRKALSELGLLENSRLPGETVPKRLAGILFDAYHQVLKLYVRLLLLMRTGRIT